MYMPICSIVSPVKAEIDIGTDWEFSSRFLAVTITSSAKLLNEFVSIWAYPAKGNATINIKII